MPLVETLPPRGPLGPLSAAAPARQVAGETREGGKRALVPARRAGGPVLPAPVPFARMGQRDAALRQAMHVWSRRTTHHCIHNFLLDTILKKRLKIQGLLSCREWLADVWPLPPVGEGAAEARTLRAEAATCGGSCGRKGVGRAEKRESMPSKGAEGAPQGRWPCGREGGGKAGGSGRHQGPTRPCGAPWPVPRAAALPGGALAALRRLRVPAPARGPRRLVAADPQGQEKGPSRKRARRAFP